MLSKIRVGCIVEQHEKRGGCYNCCESCNYDTHHCPGCGTSLMHDGREYDTGNYHFDCLEEYKVVDGKIVGYTNFGMQINNNQPLPGERHS